MFKRLFMNLSWLITALASIHLGLVALGYDIFTTTFFLTTAHSWVMPIHYVVGVAGLMSLFMYFHMLTCSHCDASGNCSCK